MHFCHRFVRLVGKSLFWGFFSFLSLCFMASRLSLSLTHTPQFELCAFAVLCRHNALEIWKSHEQFESLGVRLVCILHEWIDREVDAFAPEYWGGELYLDEDKAFNAAIHGGKVAKGNLFDMMNPFSRAWKNLRRVKAAGVVKDSNLVGDGLTLGGVMLVAKGGEVIFTFPEATFGDAPSLTDLIEAAKTAANKS